MSQSSTNGPSSGSRRRRNSITSLIEGDTAIEEDELQNADPDAVEETIVCENLSTDIDDIKETFMMLNDEQRNIVMHIYYVYNRDKTNIAKEDVAPVGNGNPKIVLQGPAGTGKSTVINFLEKLVTWEENKTSDDPQKLKVIKCAFTGKAASIIDGYTLHDMFSIPIRTTRSMRKEKLDTKKNLLENCIFFICDEISMVSQKIMYWVNTRLNQIFDNNDLYGDRFVLLAGDLYQIDPVGKALYPSSKFWTCCDFYELTQIVRQQDEHFVNALNNFRDGKLTNENIELFRSREIEDTSSVPDSVIHIFYLKEHVAKYNKEKLDKSDGEGEIVNYNVDKELDSEPLRVKVGIRYMITNNMDVGDRLANGITGVVKGFGYGKDKKVNIIWMEFCNNVIGRKARSDYYKKNPGPKSGFENLVPICQATILVPLKSNPRRSQWVPNMFPLIAAEAITAHKSQGQTFHEGVCVHFTDHRSDKLRSDKSLQYVALSRVTKKEDLYIFGNLNYTLEDKGKLKRVEKELSRLRTERNIKLAYETFENQTEDAIVYLNTGFTFKDHYQFISTDKWYNNGSLLIFTETNTTTSDKIEIPNFERDQDSALKSGGRVVCYKKSNISVEVITSTTDNENKIYLTLLLYEKYLYIIIGIHANPYNHRFRLAIQELLLKYVENKKCIFFMANCKTDSNIPDVFDSLNFRKIKVCEVINSKKEKQRDMILIRNCEIQENCIGFYAYIPSPHKPIFVKLPQISKLPQSNSDAYSPNHQPCCSSRHDPATEVTAHSSSQTSITNNNKDLVANASPVTHAAGVETGQNKRVMANGDLSLPTNTPKRRKVRSLGTLAGEPMFIIPVGYPGKMILKEHRSPIQRVILRLVLNAANPPPRIILGDIVRGALHVTCQGKDASTWITSVIGKEEVAGLLLKVVAPKDLPKPVKMVWNTTIIGAEDIGLKLDVLQRYHTSLHTELWEIENTLTSETDTEHTILVDQESADVIKASGYELFDGVGLSYFEILNDVDVGGAMENPTEDVDAINRSMRDGTDTTGKEAE